LITIFPSGHRVQKHGKPSRRRVASSGDRLRGTNAFRERAEHIKLQRGDQNPVGGEAAYDAPDLGGAGLTLLMIVNRHG
jgi:hypothetical protein